MKCQNCGAELKEQAKFCPKCGTKVEQPKVEKPVKTASSQETVSVWPEWKVEKQLGKGSYGVVYQAIRTDNNVESHAAIKVISIPADASEIDSLRSEGLDITGTRTYFKGIVDDFVGEIQMMESLKGIQNIVSVEDYKVVEKTDEIGWDIYIRMELLTPFNSYICDKNLSEKDVIKLGADICSALEICDQRSIIHRDIKPENIFVNSFGHFKLGDFGIARKLENSTGGLSQKGTFNYMAPEVANSGEYDARVDTYSLGIVLYRLLNDNRLPFLNDDKQLLNPNERKAAVERRIRGEELPAPCNASPEMADIILRACAYEPEARFASATEMKQALMNAAAGTYVIAESDLDKTTSVRSAGFNLDGTTAVRRAPSDMADITSNSKVDTFGDSEKKSKKKKIITISVLSGIAVLLLVLLISFFSSAAYGIYGDMNSEDYDSAVETYQDEVKGNFIEKSLLKMLLGDRVNDVVNDFNAGEMDYDTAVAALEALNEMGFKDAKKKIEEITLVNDADSALQRADEYYENGDYENAISEYNKVPEGSENYAEAQSKLNEVCPKYIQSVVETASAYNANKEYKEAINCIDIAYDVLPENADKTELDKVREESMTGYKTQVSNEVNSLFEDASYASAFEMIDEAKNFSGDSYFDTLRTDTENKYVKLTTTKVEDYLAAEDYISAKRVAENALTVLPDNKKLSDLEQKVIKATPTYLLDVYDPYASSDEYAEYINGETIKLAGKEYTNAFVLGSGDHAIFNIEGKHTTLKFLLGHLDGSDETDGVIKIYCDGILKKTIEFGAYDLPHKHTIDITGVKQLEFKVENDPYWYYPEYGFANVTVK